MLLRTYGINRLAEEGRKAGIGMLVASVPANVRYLSGGYRSIAQAVSATAQLYVLLDIHTAKVSYVSSVAEVPCILEHAGLDTEIFCYGGFHFDVEQDTVDPLARRAAEVIKRRYPSGEAALTAALEPAQGPVGIDEAHMNFVLFDKVAKLLPGIDLRAGNTAFMQARKIKHSEEVAALKRAAHIAESALLEALEGFEPGMTELELERRYQNAVTRRDAIPYFFVATAAKRAAYVDATNKPVPIAKGDVIRFDFGCIADGYYSDLARTACMGAPDAAISAAYEAVRIGCEQAVKGIRPGVTAEEVFDLALAGVRQAGLSGYMRHHCGHGIGLEGYDLPSIASGQTDVLTENMVLCIETPYYRLGWGGVQVENTVVVTQDGAEYLDSGDQQLIIIPCE